MTKLIYYGVIEHKDKSRGSFSMTIRGLSSMLKKEDFNVVTITGKKLIK